MSGAVHFMSQWRGNRLRILWACASSGDTEQLDIAPWPDLCWRRAGDHVFSVGFDDLADPALPFPKFRTRRQPWGTEIKEPGRPWRPALINDLEPLSPLERFAAFVPFTLRPVLRRFGWGHLRLMMLMQAGTAADQLMVANPAMAMIIASRFEGLDHARDWLAGPREAVLEAEGWATPKSAARMLSKVKAVDASPEVLDMLRRRWNARGWAKALRHAPALPGPVLRALDSDSHRLLAPSILNELVAQPARPWDRLIKELTARIEAAGLCIEEHQIASLAQLEQLIGAVGAMEGHQGHVFMADRWYPVVEDAKVSIALPPPPVPGTAAIEPLDTPAKLRREGREMGHCAASYILPVASGACYLYRMTSPERLTIQLVPDPRPQQKPAWSLGQVAGPENGRPQLGTLQLVQAWLRRMGG